MFLYDFNVYLFRLWITSKSIEWTTKTENWRAKINLKNLLKKKEEEAKKLEQLLKEKELMISSLEARFRKITMEKQKSVKIVTDDPNKSKEEQAKEDHEVVQEFFLRLSKFLFQK